MLAVLATGLLSCGLFCQQAHAFSGNIQFAGSAHASGPSGLGNTTIHFSNNWVVDAAIPPDGAYTGVLGGTPTVFHAFSFHGDGTGAVLNSAVSPQWSFTFNGHSYTFDLTSLTSGHTDSGGMAFTGLGTAFIDNGQATAASWSLHGSGNNFIFKFSGSSTSAVPDGGSAVALLGIALAGIEILRRKIKVA
jgi:VPDSG-CTERM motif